MGHVDVAGVRFELPDGRVLLDDASFRVGDGAKVALVGANGAGKTTLLRLIIGDLQPHAGVITRSGGLGVMRQFVGHGVADPANPSDDPTVADLLLSVSPPRLRAAAATVDACELVLMDTDDLDAQLAYATALGEYGDAGGYDAEVVWDVCTTAALGVEYARAKHRSLSTLSGGEQKRLVLEYLLRGPDEVLLLDEPDNYLDVPAKLWLEERLRESPKTVMFISHDRELLANTATRVVTVELGAAGNRVWTHPGGFADYHQARRDRFARFDELRRRWDEEHQKLITLVQTLKQKATYNDGMASRYQAAQTRLRKFEEAGPPTEQPREQKLRIRLEGGRTGKRAIVCEQLELRVTTQPIAEQLAGASATLPEPADDASEFGETVPELGSHPGGQGCDGPQAVRKLDENGSLGAGDAERSRTMSEPSDAPQESPTLELMKPFDLEVWYGERVAVLGSNGSGKSHFLRLLARGGTLPDLEHEPIGGLDSVAPVAHTGRARLGARVRPGWFVQTHDHPELVGRTLLDILHRGDLTPDGRGRQGMGREPAARALDRYELAGAAEQAFESLSGGQQARFQILLLELSGATLLLLDEPTDNLDVESAEALEDGLAGFAGTVVAVTHDRWFARGFDRFLVFGSDGRVVEADRPVWGETRVQRTR